MSADSSAGPPKPKPTPPSSESLLQSLASRLQRLRLVLTHPELTRLEAIRTDMLRTLEDACGQPCNPQLADRIRFATDLESLWYLRAELLATLTGCADADAAGRSLEAISARFVGVLPIAANRRPQRKR